MFVVFALLTGTAHATDIDPFRPGSSQIFGVGTLQAESPILFGNGPSGGVLAGFVQDPVVRSFSDGTEDEAVRALLPVTLFGGYTLEGLARIDVFLPVYAWVDAPVTGYAGGSMGDLAIQGVVPAWSAGDVFSIAAVPALSFPTGTRNALTRQGFSGSLTAAAGGEVPDLAVGWVANLGITGALADEIEGIGVGSTLDLVSGAWMWIQPDLRVGAEIDLRAGLAAGEEGRNTVSTGHLFAQQSLDNGLGLTVGAGTGLIAGLGAPDYRILAGFHYAERVRDADRDGIADDEDGCPDEAEDIDLFQDADGCPDLDNDADGVVDLDDGCPTDAEDLDGFEDSDGCPDLDNDGDGIADAEDACPDASGAAEQSGCPDSDADGVHDGADACPDTPGTVVTSGCPDRDLDGIADADDACPDTAKHPDEPNASSDGCPKTAFVTDIGIVIGQRIEFDSGSSRIRPESLHILDAVAKILKENPDIGGVEIQGHTDSKGNSASNLSLSQRRAEAVRNYLIGLDIDPRRLTAKGYGDLRPIDTNRTEGGRKNNRRVEFAITSREALPPAPRPTSTPKPAPTGSGATRSGSGTASGGTGSGAATPSQPGMDPDGTPGLLTVVISGGHWGQVSVDGRRIQNAPFTDQEIPAGTREIRVTNTEAGIDFVQTVDVMNGQLVRVVVPEEFDTEEFDPFDFEDLPDEAPPSQPTPWGEVEDVQQIPSETEGERRPPRGSKKR